jgi:predicted enzyme related to lactoylglutathione lyase
LVASRLIGDGTNGWVEYDLGPATLSIGNGAPDWKPSAGGGAVALEVDDFPEAMRILSAGGHPPFMGPYETPVCHLAMVADPDGNSVTIHCRKPA